MFEPIATPIAARLLALAAMRAGTLRALGDVEGHPFHGNQYTNVSELAQSLIETTNYYQGVFYFTRKDADHLILTKLPGAKVVKQKRGFVVEHEGKKLGPEGWRSLASTRPGQRQLHQAADAQFPAISVAVRYAFAQGRKAVKGKSADAVAKAVRRALLDVLPGTLTRAMTAGGDAGLGLLKKLKAAEDRALADKLFALQFNAKDPRAAAWAKDHALELADGLSETTRLAVKAALEAALLGDGTLDDVMAAVGDDARAEVIARTEAMRAVSEGQRQGWQQAVDKGLLDEGSKRVWIATAGACPICDDLDGQETTLGDEYPDPGGEGPPQHPNCRCTEGISV